MHSFCTSPGTSTSSAHIPFDGTCLFSSCNEYTKPLRYTWIAYRGFNGERRKRSPTEGTGFPETTGLPDCAPPDGDGILPGWVGPPDGKGRVFTPPVGKGTNPVGNGGEGRFAVVKIVGVVIGVTTGMEAVGITGEGRTEDASTDEITVEGTTIAELLGPLSPGMSKGKQVENNGLVIPCTELAANPIQN